MRNILITGAGGFIGSRLVRHLVGDPAFADARLTLLDRRIPDAPRDGRIRLIEGDIADAAARRDAVADGVDVVFHLAGILGGAAEGDYPLARRVNVDATLSLLEELRRPERPPRVVFASSVAVFGAPLPAAIDDDTWPRPTMTYGAQKLMIEIAVEQFSRRGWIDGLAIRLPGIVARADADARQRAAFLNLVFHAYAAGRDFTLPVPEGGTTWLISVPACVAAFVHAARLPAAAIGPRRALTLPAQTVRLGDLVAALRRAFPASRSRIAFEPDAALTAQFAAQPPLTAALGDALGFRHDGDLDGLVRNALREAA